MPTVKQAQKKPGRPGLLDEPEGTPLTACGAVKSFSAARDGALFQKFGQRSSTNWQLGRPTVRGEPTRWMRLKSWLYSLPKRLPQRSAHLFWAQSTTRLRQQYPNGAS